MWTVLFDIDGTLIRTQGVGMGALGQAIAEVYGHTETPEIPLHGRTDRGIITELFQLLNIDCNGDYSDFLDTYCKMLKTSLKSNGGTVLPGVKEVLEQLKSRPNVALGILTGNAQKAAKIKLDHFGLSEYFLFGGYGDDSCDRNDVAAQAASAAAEFLQDGYDKNKVWVLGDTVNDILCGRSIGAKVIALETGGGSHKKLLEYRPEFLWKDLTRVSSWVDSLS